MPRILLCGPVCFPRVIIFDFFKLTQLLHNTFCLTRLLFPRRFIDIFWTKIWISNKFSLFPFPLWWIPHTNQNDISVLKACRQNNLTTGNESDMPVYLPPATCFGLTWDELVPIWQKQCKQHLSQKCSAWRESWL